MLDEEKKYFFPGEKKNGKYREKLQFLSSLQKELKAILCQIVLKSEICKL